MNKELILDKIKQEAGKNNGAPLGMGKFEEATGITVNDWRGKFWTKWSDSLIEAGFQPNKFLTPKYDEKLKKKMF
ncbi:hypothetical protein MNBD_NITROSPINAE02-825 [hydrothermal vent metagenome]|uniref:Uncharacterized protein n=1 Tax=hydrothermal vent metagenome TaxID=652676 RepID=A0A3B1CDA5_9ZZZZ